MTEPQSKIKPYECVIDDCSKSFKTKHNRKVHHYMHTGERLWVCGVCKEHFQQKVSRDRHHENRHCCKHCGVEIGDTEEVIKHYRKAHSGMKLPRIGNRNWKCDCGESIQQFQKLKEHVSNCPRIKANRIVIAKFYAEQEGASEPCATSSSRSAPDNERYAVAVPCTASSRSASDNECAAAAVPDISSTSASDDDRECAAAASVPDISWCFMEILDEDQHMQSPPGCFYDYLLYDNFVSGISFSDDEDDESM